jgi:hypothetical protein
MLSSTICISEMLPTPSSSLVQSERWCQRLRTMEGVSGLHIAQVTPDHFILVILGDDAEVLDKFATEVGSPWMMENVIPLLALPPERYLGALVATTD